MGTDTSEGRAGHGTGTGFRPKRWRRNEVAPRYLLDSRLFQRLCAPGEEAALAGFRASLRSHGIVSDPRAGDLPALELTPLAFLAAIGVEPPPVDTFPLPPGVLKRGESMMAISVVVKMAQERLNKAPELKPDQLAHRIEELRQATAPAAHELLDLCLTRALASEGFVERIITHIAFDFAYRFPFPEVLREEVFEFLCASLFAAGETVAGLSMMRAIRVLWNRAYPRLLKRNPGAREELQALDREMKPRTREDFLAWEVVHYSILGVAAKDRFQPVTAFTVDSAERLKARSIAYKSALRAFLDQISPNDLAEIRPRLDAWKPGTLVTCREDGTFAALLPTGDLPVFVGEKAAAE